MMLGDMGAEVIRIDRVQPSGLGIEIPPEYELRNRNKKSVALDLKGEAGRATLLKLIARADVLLEGFRPGVAERLGIGPEECWTHRPQLVYARATGWGQAGPLAQTAGHDINYIALSGALGMMGAADGPPAIPLNLVGDYGGGAMYMAFGILCAVFEAQQSGKGQVVDAAMVDGAASLLTVFHGMHQSGLLNPRGQNVLDGGAPYYRCYETRDGGWMAVGAIEPKFYAAFLAGLGLDPADLPKQNDRSAWPELHRRFAACFKARTRQDWEAVFDGTDACVSPVLSLDEAPLHPHAAERHAIEEVDGIAHPAPAPRLSRTPGAIRSNAPAVGQDTRAVLEAFELSPEEVAAALRAAGLGATTAG